MALTFRALGEKDGTKLGNVKKNFKSQSLILQICERDHSNSLAFLRQKQKITNSTSI